MAIEVFLAKVEASNWRSVNFSLAEAGFNASLVSTTQIASLPRDSILVLPGVGNIKHLAEQFTAAYELPDLADTLRLRNISVLGICLGFQFLCQSSGEDSSSPCLSMLDLEVEALFDPPLPSVGWKRVAGTSSNTLLEPLTDLLNNEHFYFTHCYGVKRFPPPSVSLNTYLYSTSNGNSAVAAIVTSNIIGLQFHPEKSGPRGANVLKSAIRFLGAQE